METRSLGAVGSVSEVGLGTWNIGSDWGPVSDDAGRKAIEAALDSGITFLDTADVYGDGRSEKRIAEVLTERDAYDDVIVGTKAGRRLSPHTAAEYTEGNLRSFINRSRKNLDVETLDLLQLHCPPTDVYYDPTVFDALETFTADGLINNYGVSVERVEEGLKAIEYDGVESIQIIFNPFRQRPNELLFDRAAANDVGIIVRVPLASGLLTGALSKDSTFPADDHRNYNRDGDAFDVGETFAGVPFETGVEAAAQLEEGVPAEWSLATFTLRWILDHDAVSTVIPGSTNSDHIRSNANVSTLRSLTDTEHTAASNVYDEHIRSHVHHRW